MTFRSCARQLPTAMPPARPPGSTRFQQPVLSPRRSPPTFCNGSTAQGCHVPASGAPNRGTQRTLDVHDRPGTVSRAGSGTTARAVDQRAFETRFATLSSASRAGWATGCLLLYGVPYSRSDPLGDHRAACATSGVLAVATVCQEAGARMARNVRAWLAMCVLADMNLPILVPDVPRNDPLPLPCLSGTGFRLRWIPPASALSLAPVSNSRGADSAYPELLRRGPQRLRVLACETGGRWSDESPASACLLAFLSMGQLKVCSGRA